MTHTLNNFLRNRGFYHFEGYSQEVDKQVIDLINLINDDNIKNVMEIGFNAGHSAEIFLKFNKNIHLTSFDINLHDYVKHGVEYIQSVYENRHSIIYGDSTITVPQFINDNPGKKFDLIFIDGGHDYDIVKKDMENCLQLCHENTIIIMDDTIFIKGWEANYTIGPSLVWKEYVDRNEIIQIESKNYYVGRGMSWGKINNK